MGEETIWKAMYLRLVRGILEASGELPVAAFNARAQEELNRALQDAEEMYLEAGGDSDDLIP